LMPILLNDFNNKAVLITGGTMGIGLETGLAFAKQGAHCILTHKWGNADIEEIKNIFAKQGAREPLIVQSDVAEQDDVENLLQQIKQDHDRIEVFVSNVSFALLTKSLSDYSERGLFKSIDYCVWPLIEFTKKCKSIFHSYPRYIVGLSSHGPDAYHMNYDFVAAVKSIMETFTKYLNYRLGNQGVNINVLRARFVKTNSLWATFGEEFEAFGHKYDTPGLFIEAREVATAIQSLCSGLMDGVSGQILNLDKGSSFADNIMRYYEEQEVLGL
jgi:NAD(P)-dependent dehydrogenase (short-subunit alcohol dehydrogenase family)